MSLATEVTLIKVAAHEFSGGSLTLSEFRRSNKRRSTVALSHSLAIFPFPWFPAPMPKHVVLHMLVVHVDYVWRYESGVQPLQHIRDVSLPLKCRPSKRGQKAVS